MLTVTESKLTMRSKMIKHQASQDTKNSMSDDLKLCWKKVKTRQDECNAKCINISVMIRSVILIIFVPTKTNFDDLTTTSNSAPCE